MDLSIYGKVVFLRELGIYIFISRFTAKRVHFERETLRRHEARKRDGHFLFEHCFASRLKVYVERGGGRERERKRDKNHCV